VDANACWRPTHRETFFNLNTPDDVTQAEKIIGEAMGDKSLNGQ
jgi:hypothetical protein